MESTGHADDDDLEPDPSESSPNGPWGNDSSIPDGSTDPAAATGPPPVPMTSKYLGPAPSAALDHANDSEQQPEFAKPMNRPHRPSLWADVDTPLRANELFAAAGSVVAADLTLTGHTGYLGIGVCFLLAVFFLLAGRSARQRPLQSAVLVAMMGLVAARLMWCGDGLVIAAGILILSGLSLSLAGGELCLFDAAHLVGLIAPRGFLRVQIFQSRLIAMLREWQKFAPFAVALAYLLPVCVGLAFAGLFVLANPDVVTLISRELTQWATQLEAWVNRLLHDVSQPFVWIGALLVMLGLIHAVAPMSSLLQVQSQPSAPREDVRSPLHAAFRNTIWTVVVLFAGYLVFEFYTMGFREFPVGFYYSGYAHQGAFWLTVALALATVLLSAMFRGSYLNDPRMPSLRRTAMFWAAENLLLAAAAFNRLAIYIQFNGMTRMRVVGILGICAVVAGFVLVIVKIWQQRNFHWVIRKQLVALAAAVIAYAVLPIDLWVNQFNVRQILRGNLAPSTQLAHHETSSLGYLAWLPLLDCPDPIIRDGVRGLLRIAYFELKSTRIPDWRSRQFADERLIQLLSEPAVLDQIQSAPEDGVPAFRDYSYQWY